ncbi:DDE-type integrase/transposase/recombinase [Streptomyces sviceus]|uniref:DDE-type integrase/transposase/recombinase n=1 Tax=Streptomyces sviceus TaxID=285530 RepID=UPI003830A7FF
MPACRHRRRRGTTAPAPRSGSAPANFGNRHADRRTQLFAPAPPYVRPDPGLDTRWCGDITCIPTEEVRLCPATVIDIASRRVAGWSTADHLRAHRTVVDALRSACRRRRPARQVIFHADRGG